MLKELAQVRGTKILQSVSGARLDSYGLGCGLPADIAHQRDRFQQNPPRPLVGAILPAGPPRWRQMQAQRRAILMLGFPPGSHRLARPEDLHADVRGCREPTSASLSGGENSTGEARLGARSTSRDGSSGRYLISGRGAGAPGIGGDRWGRRGTTGFLPRRLGPTCEWPHSCGGR